MNRLAQHVNDLFKDVPESEQKASIMQEVLQNLEEKVWDLMEQGKTEEDAINKAIVEFGDIEDLTKELGINKSAKREKSNKKNNTKLNLEYSIWGSVLIIALFVFMNFYYSSHVIWFVYPTFAVLWWPLTIYF